MIKITKLKQIDESEARTNNILKNPKFTSWFNGSKVVDSNGNPLVCYHGTTISFNKFRPLSHFGTIDASNKFIGKQARMTGLNIFGQNDQILPVYLSIKNPLEIKDFGSETKDFGFDLYAYKLITWEELLQIYPSFAETVKIITTRNTRRVNLDNLKDNILNYTQFNHSRLDVKKLISIFKQKGYDGFYYTNEIEDKGSISWVIFNSNQVWPIYQSKPDEEQND